MTQSGNSMERELRDDPNLKGEVVEDRLRKIVLARLVYYYVVSPDDRLATVWSVRSAETQAGGPAAIAASILRK